MDEQNLTSAVEVIDALGGTSAVADLTHRKYTAAFNWRSFNAFPPNTYIVMTGALAAIGKTAPASLWGMVAAEAREPEQRRAAS